VSLLGSVSSHQVRHMMAMTAREDCQRNDIAL
jgi:hypothetical protein